MKTYNDIGDLYRDKFSGYEQEPPAEVWSRIQTSTKRMSIKRKTVFSAVAVAVVATAVYVALNISLPEKEIAKNRPNEPIAVETSQNNNLGEVQANNVTERSHFESKEKGQTQKNESKKSDSHFLFLSETNDYRISEENSNNEAVMPPTPRREGKPTEEMVKGNQETAPEKTPPIVICKDTMVCENSIVRLFVLNAKNLRWSTGETNSVIYVNPSSDEQYSATFTTASNRDTTVSIYIKCVRCSQLFIPSAFTPNGDEQNDVFSAVSEEEYDYFEMRISSADGKELFVSKDIKHGWDGTYKNVLQPHGVYRYAIRYKDAFGKMEKKNGEFLLILQ